MTTTAFRRTDRSLTGLCLAAIAGFAALSGPAPAQAGHGGAHDERQAHARKCSLPAEECVHAMAEKLRNRGWVGIEMAEKDAEGRPVVTAIVTGSPAERAGFARGDVLVSFNGVRHADGETAVNAEVQRSSIPGKTITIGVLRGGSPLDLEVTLGRIPDYLLAQWVGYHMLDGHSGDEAPRDTPRP